MIAIVYLIPIALLLGGVGLAAFFWAVRSGQYDDLDGAAQRILIDEDERVESPASVVQPPGP